MRSIVRTPPPPPQPTTAPTTARTTARRTDRTTQRLIRNPSPSSGSARNAQQFPSTTFPSQRSPAGNININLAAGAQQDPQEILALSRHLKYGPRTMGTER